MIEIFIKQMHLFEVFLNEECSNLPNEQKKRIPQQNLKLKKEYKLNTDWKNMNLIQCFVWKISKQVVNGFFCYLKCMRDYFFRYSTN